MGRKSCSKIYYNDAVAAIATPLHYFAFVTVQRTDGRTDGRSGRGTHRTFARSWVSSNVLLLLLLLSSCCTWVVRSFVRSLGRLDLSLAKSKMCKRQFIRVWTNVCRYVRHSYLTHIHTYIVRGCAPPHTCSKTKHPKTYVCPSPFHPVLEVSEATMCLFTLRFPPGNVQI